MTDDLDPDRPRRRPIRRRRPADPSAPPTPPTAAAVRRRPPVAGAGRGTGRPARRRPPAQPRSAGRSRIAVVALVVARVGRGRGAAHRPVGPRDGPRLRPGQHRRLRRGPPRPARRPAPGRRRVPVEVPGLRRPGRARDASSTRSSTTWSATPSNGDADVHDRHQAVVRRRARVQRRAAAARPRRSTATTPRRWARSAA